MEITKTKAKTTLNLKTTIAQLRSMLDVYQQDQLSDLMAEFCQSSFPNYSLPQGAAVKFARICMENGKEFSDLVEKSGTPWLPSPEPSRGSDGWVEILTNYPYIFGITDDVVTDDVDVIFVTFTELGITRNVSPLIDNI